jgi:hypothetical protein
MIYWDLDGVLRNLVHFASCEVTEWDQLIDGVDLFKFIGDRLNVLEEAPEFPYVSVANSLDVLVIMTNQPVNWISYTERWISKHLPLAERIYVNKIESKLKYLRDGDLLVDDYPYFTDYSKIILVDRPYNQNVESPLARVHNPEELELVVSEIRQRERLTARFAGRKSSQPSADSDIMALNDECHGDKDDEKN